MAVKDARYEDLGQIVVDIVPSETRWILLYVEFEDGVISPSLFYELNGEVHYVFSDEALTNELIRLQGIFGPDVKAMEFELKGEKFSTRFAYADQFDAEADTSARTDAVLQRCFGHASAHYPSL